MFQVRQHAQTNPRDPAADLKALHSRSALVREMAEANTGWGAPRIHGELLKLGIDVSQRTVGRLMPRTRKPPSQTWRTFLDKHVKDMASMDFFGVSTVGPWMRSWRSS